MNNQCILPLPTALTTYHAHSPCSISPSTGHWLGKALSPAGAPVLGQERKWWPRSGTCRYTGNSETCHTCVVGAVRRLSKGVRVDVSACKREPHMHRMCATTRVALFFRQLYFCPTAVSSTEDLLKHSASFEHHLGFTTNLARAVFFHMAMLSISPIQLLGEV